jgi:hypothetical protein
MATIRLRPGPWKVVHDGTGLLNPEIQIDYEKFDVANGSTVEFEVTKMGIFDSADNMLAFRNPVKTVVSTSSTGGELSKPTTIPSSK